MNKSDEYSSYMLRFRRMHKDNQPTWVVFVQAIQTGQVVCFPRLDGLIEFLQTRFGEGVELEAAIPQSEAASEEANPEPGRQPFEA